MRTVTQYAFDASCSSNQMADDLYSQCNRAVDVWLHAKGNYDSGSGVVTMDDGRRADCTLVALDTAEGKTSTWRLNEPTTGGIFETRIQIGIHSKTVVVACRLSIGNSGNILAPHSFSARCPKVIRNLLLLNPHWKVGGTLITPKPIRYVTADEGRVLVDLLLSRDRALPIIVVARSDGLLLHPDIIDKLSADIAGLGIVADVDLEASRNITRDLGKELSCFDGGIRIYWPHLNLRSTPWEHPLWTSRRLLNGVTGTALAAQRIRNTIRKRIFAVSTYAIRLPDIFDRVEALYSRTQIEVKVQKALKAASLEEVAEAYAQDNDNLRRLLADERSANQLLRQELYKLQYARAWADRDDEVTPETEAPPSSVKEAVERSRRIHAAEITFGDNVSDGLDSLSPEAGPPEKIFEYLDYLAEMAKALRAGPLGVSQIGWLNQWGVKASNESETVVNSKDETRRRTWHDGRGLRVFEMHLKPNDATSPDLCARIYFEWDAVTEKIIVGWVGRHP